MFVDWDGKFDSLEFMVGGWCLWAYQEDKNVRISRKQIALMGYKMFCTIYVWIKLDEPTVEVHYVHITHNFLCKDLSSNQHSNSAFDLTFIFQFIQLFFFFMYNFLRFQLFQVKLSILLCFIHLQQINRKLIQTFTSF